METVEIRGDGVAASCCALRLAAAGHRVALRPADRARLPAILLGDAALMLMRDVLDRPDLLRDAARIRRRVVAWGPDQEPAAVEHSAVVVSETALLDELQQGVRLAEPADGDPAWTVFAGSSGPTSASERRFGARSASASSVRLKPDALPETCWIEALTEGWLFLVTTSPGSGWLLAVGGSAAELLDRSRLVRGQVAEAGEEKGRFRCSPRIASPLGGPGWIACGTGAIAFDPICGDGTAHAIREAILASAVINGVLHGGDAAELLEHYESRLIAGFARHLAACREFYKARRGDWWRRELQSLEEGLAWCSNRTAPPSGFRYRLQGFDLEAVHP